MANNSSEGSGGPLAALAEAEAAAVESLDGVATEDCSSGQKVNG